MLIVPPAVREDLENYSEIKKIREQNSEGFWLGTFPDWVRKVDPELGDRLATSEEELEALQKIKDRYLPSLGEVSSRDVLLYQAFVLKRENSNQPNQENYNQRRNAIYQENRQRIEILERIEPEWWETMLGNRLCNLDVATQLKSAPPPPPYQNQPTILIVDESQDFLLAKLKALIAVREAWEIQKHSTYLWLLGDLNQRIQPGDFRWEQLELGRPIELKYNYRNSRHILKFANQFLEFANQENARYNGRHFPKPSDPEYAVEVGEQVRLLEYSSSELALKFLAFLDLRVKASGEGQDERYFLQQSANQVKVLWTNPDENQYEFSSIEILNAEKAKGREFDACVAFRIFENNGISRLEESFQWYTLLTRPRSRLLVVATTEELERIGRNYFECCETIDSAQAASWITEFASGVDINLLIDNVQKTQERLLKGCDNGHPYLDTYFVLNLAKIESEILYQWEQEAINRLQGVANFYLLAIAKLLNNQYFRLLDCHFHTLIQQCRLQQRSNSLQEELENVPSDNISLRCLLLRAMNCSWQAVEEASRFQNSNWKEYKRLVESIAQDLEHKDLLYEAARVREKIGQPIPKDFPFSDKIANRSGSLVSLLCQAMLDRPFPDALDK